MCVLGLPRPTNIWFTSRSQRAASMTFVMVMLWEKQETRPPKVYFGTQLQDVTQKTWTARLWVKYREGSRFFLVLRQYTAESIVFHHIVLASQTDPPIGQWIELREQDGSRATWMKYNGRIWEYRDDLEENYNNAVR